MRNTTFVCAFFVVITASGLALAQSRGHRCEQKNNDLNNYTSRLSTLNMELAPIDQEIDRLNRRMQELRSVQQQKINERNALQESVRNLEGDMARLCRPIRGRECRALDNRVDNLRERALPLNERMTAMRNDIQNLNQEVGRSSREAERIENQYNQLGCDNLVPGRTAQTTIDRCSDLFSEWNHVQSDINADQASITNLRARYDQFAREQQTLRSEISRLVADMRTNCRDSERFGELERIDRDHNDFVLLRSDLDTMASRIDHFRTLRILKPTVRPRDDRNDPPHTVVPRRY
jgi:chromosome segregation ATPase